MIITVKKNLLLFFGWYSINFSLLLYTKIKSTKTINVFIKSSTIKKFLSRNSLLKLIKNKAFTKYYNKYPKNINDIFKMVDRVKNYFKKNEANF